MERVPCPIKNSPECPIFNQEGECYEDKHHKYWPASNYVTKQEKEFRNLDVNKVIICRWIHNTIHSVALPPEHPSHAQIRRATNDNA